MKNYLITARVLVLIALFAMFGAGNAGAQEASPAAALPADLAASSDITVCTNDINTTMPVGSWVLIDGVSGEGANEAGNCTTFSGPYAEGQEVTITATAPGYQPYTETIVYHQPVGTGSFFHNISLTPNAAAQSTLVVWAVEAGSGRPVDAVITVNGMTGQPRPDATEFVGTFQPGDEITIAVSADGYQSVTETIVYAPSTSGENWMGHTVHLIPAGQTDNSWLTVCAGTADGSPVAADIQVNGVEGTVPAQGLGCLYFQGPFTDGQQLTITATADGFAPYSETYVFIPTDMYHQITMSYADDDMNPAFATVTFSVFACDNVTEPHMSTATADLTFRSLNVVTPEANDLCDATTAQITLVNPTTYETITVPNSLVVDVAVGTWQVYVNDVEVGSIEVIDGANTDVVIEIPSGDPYREGQSLHVSKFYCENISTVIFRDPTMEGATGPAADDSVPAETECAPGSATFSIYLVGDGTADYDQVVVNGAGSIELPAGDYVIVEEGTGAQFNVTLTRNVNSFLVVFNPIAADSPILPGGNIENGDVPGLNVPDDGAPVAPPPTTPAASTSNTATSSSSTTASTSTTGNGTVTSLPSTGLGSDDSATLLIAAATAAAAIAGAGAFTIRKRN